MDTAEGSTWEDLRREARSIERRLEAAIQRYGSVDIESQRSFDEAEKAEGEIEGWLAKMAELIQALDNCPSSGRSSNKAQIQRLREILFDYKTEFHNAQSKQRENRERSLLLEEVRRSNLEDATAEELLLQERFSLSSSQKATDSILGQAHNVSEALKSQRGTISNATSRLFDMGKSVPGVEALMKKIRNKRTRDNTILAIVIALCISFILIYIARSWGL